MANPKEGGLGLFIIKTLMDEVNTISNTDEGTTIKMTKYLGVGI
ncbi:histidine kinase-like ATPase domain protein [[Clostridium] sordellii ATCC 9714]|nr:histidine kinase-like ATPase domain protein [[Clostridium] sordellii ATCC 9714] [Paeniclostridium sordellii ATCC 9714]